jgi:hypothetical protein
MENYIYTEPNFGRCDRESKCAYHLRPTHNVILNDINFLNSQPIKIQSYIDISEVAEHGNNFKKNNKYLILKIKITR